MFYYIHDSLQPLQFFFCFFAKILNKPLDFYILGKRLNLILG